MYQRPAHLFYKTLSLAGVVLFFCACSNKNKTGLFELLPATKTNISFSNNLPQKERLNILYYLYYYNGAGVGIGDINNDGLSDVYFAANDKGANKLYLNKGNFVFEDITQKAGVAGTADWCTGVTIVDINADGFLDIYVSTVSQRYGLKGHNELFINNGISTSPTGEGRGEVTFTESAAKYGLDLSCFTTQTAFFDYDKDGDLDCYVLNQSNHPHANVVNANKRSIYDTLSGDRLYRNDITATGKFTDVSKQAGIYQSSLGYGLGIAVSDINNDGWEDIYVGNDFHENDYYYVNNKNGTFTEEGAKHFNHYSRFSMGNDVADFNNDGQLDIITVDMLPPDEKTLKTYGSDENPDIYNIKIDRNGYQKQYSKNCLQLNNGNGINFSEVSLQSGVSATDWSWTPLMTDFDNDGNKDLFISSGIIKRPVDLDYVRYISELQMTKGIDFTDAFDAEAIQQMPDGSSHPFFFKGDGHLSFKDVSNEWGTGNMKGYYCGAAYGDLDNDGDLDAIINTLNGPASILKNNTAGNKSITVSLAGDSLNTKAIGAKVYIVSNGKMQYQQLTPTRGFQSSTDYKLVFGLNDLAKADSVLVVWPNGKYELKTNVAANTTVSLNQKSATELFDHAKFFKTPDVLYSDITAIVNNNWKHTENEFFDHNRQYLIPHGQSTRGPRLAVADVNKDGFEDFYVCGAHRQTGALMIQNNAGSFSQKNLQVTKREEATEEVDAVFFDANNDTWPDLYVVSGGNFLDDGSEGLNDHMYLNDGKGNLVQAISNIPSIKMNKSCVAAADADKDGDIDLFVGVLASTKAYGLPQSSYLLLNDGKGNFSLASNNVINLENIGMVTSAAFTDINKDSWPDLVVTGEWMPIKIFINNKGVFKETSTPASTGLWQNIFIADVNKDGFEDILAGNWGLNNKFVSGKNGAVKLYVKDFDKNGTTEQILCYTIDGKEYTFLAKDELERALPVLKKHYLKYTEVAGKTVDYLFFDLFKDYTELKAETLASSCFINNGKGGFDKVELPPELQMAPLFSFAPSANTGSYIGAGNFYNVTPYEGRYDAQLPVVFAFNKTINKFETSNKLPTVTGEVRDMKWLNSSNEKKILITAKNNLSLSFLQPQ